MWAVPCEWCFSLGIKFIITRLYWSLKCLGNAKSKTTAVVALEPAVLKINRLMQVYQCGWREGPLTIFKFCRKYVCYCIIFLNFFYLVYLFFLIFLSKIKASKIENLILTTNKMTPNWNKLISKLNLLKTRIVSK